MRTEKGVRQKYTFDFKRDVVVLATEQAYKPSEASRSLEIKPDLIHRWPQKFSGGAAG